MSLGQIIHRRRKQLGLTQDRLASAAGISKPYLSHIETGKAKNPPADPILRAMEKALGLERGSLTRVAHLARTPSDVRAEREFLEAEVTHLRGVLRDLMGPKATGARAKGLRRLSPVKLSHPKTYDNAIAISAGRMVPIINRVSAGYPDHFTDLDYPPSVADEYIRCIDVHDPQAFAARVVGDSMEPRYHEGDVVIFAPNTLARNGDDCFVRFADEAGTTFKRFYRDDDATIRLQPLNNKYPAEVHDRRKITGLWPAVLRIEQVRRPSSRSP